MNRIGVEVFALRNMFSLHYLKSLTSATQQVQISSVNIMFRLRSVNECVLENTINECWLVRIVKRVPSLLHAPKTIRSLSDNSQTSDHRRGGMFTSCGFSEHLESTSFRVLRSITNDFGKDFCFCRILTMIIVIFSLFFIYLFFRPSNHIHFLTTNHQDSNVTCMYYNINVPPRKQPLLRALNCRYIFVLMQNTIIWNSLTYLFQ